MQKTRTSFAAFDEPEPLARPGYVTAPTMTVPAFDSVLDRIDRALAEDEDASDVFERLVTTWTHIWLTRSELPAWTERRSVLPSRLATELLNIGTHWGPTVRLHLPSSAPTSPRPSAQLDAGLADIQRWLKIGLGPASDAAGISRGTVYAWRDRGTTPRPATVSAVLRVHGLIASAVAAAGEEQARAWFHSGSPSPLDDMVAAAGDSEKLRRVSTRLRRELTAPPVPPPNAYASVTADDLNR